MRIFSVFLTVLAMNLALVAPAAAGSFSLESFFTGRSSAEGSFQSITGVKGHSKSSWSENGTAAP